MRVPIQVRYNDYDAKGHVNNAVYLTYFEIARTSAWRSVSDQEEAGFILAEARVSYRSPAMIGDPLVAEVTTGECRTKAWVWHYRLLDERDDRVVAEGQTTQVMFDYEARQPIPIPDDLRAALAGI